MLFVKTIVFTLLLLVVGNWLALPPEPGIVDLAADFGKKIGTDDVEFAFTLLSITLALSVTIVLYSAASLLIRLCLPLVCKWLKKQ